MSLSAKKTMSSTSTNKVVIKDSGHEKKTTPALPTPQVEVTAAPPPGGFIIKDEVEMLRAGFKNKHGDAVKSQAKSVNIEL